MKAVDAARVVATVAVLAVAVPVVADAAEGAENHVRIEDETVNAEVTFELTSEEPLNYWDVALELPDGAKVRSVEDTAGGIDEYTVDGGTLEFRTNTGVGRRTETVTVEYAVEDVTVETYAGGDLRVVEVGIVGFGTGTDDEDGTTARITADGTVFSASPDASFDLDVTGDEAVYTGNGATTVRVAVGDPPGNGYDNYAVFGGETDLSEADNAYTVVPAAFGFEASADRHPVVVVNDTRYDGVAEGWSDGQYRPGGVVLLRASASDAVGTVLHETAHAYNAEATAWSDVSVGWFEEGTSRYVEFLADRRRGEPRRALFVGDRLRDGNGVGPRGSVDDLLGYYADDGFMRTWNPSDGDENRRFGYAFSELALRAYVEENGPDALRETYDELLKIERRVTSEEDATALVLNSMDADGSVLRPCASSSRDAVVDCLRRINRMDATVPAYDGADAETYPFDTSVVAGDDGTREDLSEGAGENGARSDGTGEKDGTGTGEEDPDADTDGNGGVVSVLGDLFAGIVEFIRGLVS